jgi:hypothetical protein
VAEETPRAEGLALAVRVVHASPGRIRVRVPREALSDGALREAERALAALPGVREVRKNPLASSIVINYDAHALDLPALLAAIAQAGVTFVTPSDAREDSTDAAAESTSLARSLTAFFDKADRRLADATSGAADLRTLVPLGLAVLAAREVLAGRVTAAPWYALLWYAVDSFIKLQKPGPSADQSGR